MNWQNLTTKKNIIIAIAILVFILLYMLVFMPLWYKQEQLQQELITETELTNYLLKAKEQIGDLPNYKSLSASQAKQYIYATFKKNNVIIDKFITQVNKAIIIINKVAFAKLLNTFMQLKNKYGIVVVLADIKRIDSGVVNAKFTLKHP